MTDSGSEKMNAPLGEEELDQVSGGGSFNDSIHDLSKFIYRTVCNVVQYDPTAGLTLRSTPGGAIIPGVVWQNGDHILVHAEYKEDYWCFAYDRRSGNFGYVNSNNLR